MEKAAVYIILPLATLFIFIGLEQARKRAHIRSHIEALAQAEMRQIRDSIDLYTLDMHQYTWESERAGTLRLSASRLYDVLAGQANERRYLEDNERWKSTHRITDPWGNDYNTEVAIKSELAKDGTARKVYAITIWSNGANGRDDLKRRDDIVLEDFQVALVK